MKIFFKIVMKGCLIIIAIPTIILITILAHHYINEKFPKEKKIEDYTDHYTITKNSNHPKFKVLVENFKKQEHLFEFDICEYKYNNKSFFFGDTPQKIITIFGKPDEEIKGIYYEYNGSFETKYYNKEEFIKQMKKEHGKEFRIIGEMIYYKYKKLKIEIEFKSLDNKSYALNYFYLDMSSIFKKVKKTEAEIANTPPADWPFVNSKFKTIKYDPLFKIILFREIPYQLDMTLNEFMELSNLSHKKLRRTGSFHRDFFMFQEECSPKEETRIYIHINSKASYGTKGSGRLTWTGDFDPTESSPIESLSFSAQTLKEYLNR